MAVSSDSSLPLPVDLSGFATLNSLGEFVSVQHRTTQVLGAIDGASDHVRGHGDRHQLEGDDDRQSRHRRPGRELDGDRHGDEDQPQHLRLRTRVQDRKSTRLNSSHVAISYAVFCLKKKTNTKMTQRRLSNTSTYIRRLNKSITLHYI